MRTPRWQARRAASSRAGPWRTAVAASRGRVRTAPRIRPPRRTRRGCRTARRSGSPAHTRNSRCRTAARPARRSCRARDRSRRAAPRAREARSPAAGSLVLLGQGIDEGLEIVRGGAPRKRTPVHKEARRSPYAERLAFLHARLDPRLVALPVQTGVVLVEVEPDGPSEVAEQRARVLPRLRPLMVGEQLVVHLPELALLSRALGRQGGIAGILVRGQRKVAKAPPQLPRGDQLLTDHRHLHRRKRRAERTLEVRILCDPDRRGRRPQRIAMERIRRRHWERRTRRWERGTPL